MHNGSTDPSDVAHRGASFGAWRSTGIRMPGMGVWQLRVFLVSTGLPLRLLLSTPLCLCRVGLAWLGVASWLAPVVAAVEQSSDIEAAALQAIKAVSPRNFS